MVSRAATHRRQALLVEELTAKGLLSVEWRLAWERVNRHEFIPNPAGAGEVWRQLPTRCQPVTGEEEWWDLVYSDEPIVTQLDDGHANGPGVATSSNSKPSMVALMLDLLTVRDDDRVLEIGTATGFVSALLCERLGSERVTSVEIDDRLAARAASNLAAAGYAPTLLVGDGEHGSPELAPFDKLLATCAFRTVPHRLVRQVRPGGVLVAPLARSFWSGALVRLEVQRDGTASGLFCGGASFMPMRSHRAKPKRPVDTSQVSSRRTELLPSRLLSLGFALYAGARLPDLSMVDGESGAGRTRVWLTDLDGSGAIADEDGGVSVFGPRDLWDELFAVHTEYVEIGRPAAGEFGLTVGPDGDRVWVQHPDLVVSAC